MIKIVTGNIVVQERNKYPLAMLIGHRRHKKTYKLYDMLQKLKGGG